MDCGDVCVGGGSGFGMMCCGEVVIVFRRGGDVF